MQSKRVFAQLLGLTRVVVEGVDFDELDEVLVVSIRPRKGSAKPRCGVCGKRCPRYDNGSGRRRWRALDLGTVRAFVEADAPRVRCRDHGVVVVQVPWARHGAGHTLAFDDTVAWLAVQTSRSAVQQLMRVAWRTVGAIVARVSADAAAKMDRFAGLRRIGIDEISYKRGQRYLTVVVDHDTRRLIWAAVGRDRAGLHRFFDALGDERAAQITHVSSDSADWVAFVVAARCPNAVQCADPFHVIQWVQAALDDVRRESWNAARGALRAGRNPRASGDALKIARARYALWKNPDTLTAHQRLQLEWIAKTDPRLHRAYLLKEGLRLVFALGGDAGKEALDRWLSWAQRCRIPSFAKVVRRVMTYRAQIDATLEFGLSNGLIESTNTKIRLLTRMAFGFKNPDALIGLAMLSLGGLKPPLPGRAGAG